MRIRLATPVDLSGARVPESFLQSPFWASFKSLHGWNSRVFVLSDYAAYAACDDGSVYLSVLFRSFSGLFTIAYVPMGPDVCCKDPALQGSLLSELARLMGPFLPRNTVLIRFDPPWGTSVPVDGQQVFPPEPACRKAPVKVQPPDTVVLDLRCTAAELLESMKPKWRYNIRLAGKKGVSIRCLEGEAAAGAGLDVFWELYRTTSERDGIAIHSKTYYADLLRLGAGTEKETSSLGKIDGPRLYLYIAEYNDKPLASIIVLRYGKEAVYLYGASSNEYRNLMSTYALQWKSISDAKEAGCERYDLYGIPPNDDPNHPMHGLYRFKTGFGGGIVHRVGSLDIPLRPAIYRLYALAEAARTFWFKRVKKLFRKDIRGTS